jgi:hypothetical protein
MEDWNCLDEWLRGMEELRLTLGLERLVPARVPYHQKADRNFGPGGPVG